MLGTRIVFLLLAFIISVFIPQLVETVLGAAAQVLPGLAAAPLLLAGIFLASAAEFFAAGFLFTLLSGLDWRRAAAWTVLGTAFLNFLCDGPSALSRAYFMSELFSWLGLLRAAASAAAGAYGCWHLEQRETAPWVDEARAMILSMIGQ